MVLRFVVWIFRKLSTTNLMTEFISVKVILFYFLADTTMTKLLVFGIGKSANHLATLAVTLFTSELFPTPIRGTALFYASIIDMIGFLTIPFIMQEVSVPVVYPHNFFLESRFFWQKFHKIGCDH